MAEYDLPAGPAELFEAVRHTLLFIRQPDQLGEVTLATTPSMTPVPHSFDTVRRTDVALETNAEILAKKLRYRMVLRQQLVPRDLYDIAVARDRDPAALRQALGVIDSFSLQEMYTHLDSPPERWMANHRQRLIRPTYRRAASSPVSIVKHIVADHIHSRPPPERPRTDISWDR